MTLRSLALLCLVLWTGAGCRRFPDREAERIVRAYNANLIEAYRTGDEQLMEGLVGDAEARKLLGLIGVKSDMGMTLDAALLEFRMIGVERPAPEIVEVLTEERWEYRERRIGTGEVIGEESKDHYFMRYSLQPSGKRWLVEKVAFERPPEIGRKSAPDRADPAIFHGMIPPSAGSRQGRDSRRAP